jgi:ribosomal-protein-alanine N-acetyltransferase
MSRSSRPAGELSVVGLPPMPRPTSRHPGWPAQLGPVRARAGLVALRPARLFDASTWSAIRRRDERHLAPWEPGPIGQWAQRHTPSDWVLRHFAMRAAGRRGLALPFVITVDGRLAGQVMVANVVREPLLSANIGYWVGTHVIGGGVATAATAMAVDHCFNDVGMHRVEATVRPENGASLRVLEKLGFRHEGLFRRYLDVDGAWRDHQCFALTVEDRATSLVSRLVADGRVTRA